MNKELTVFQHEQFGSIRTVAINDEPWFVLKDVCAAFGEQNYRRVSGRLEEEEKGVSQIATPGGNQNMTVVNESGLYSALFAMQPEKARGVSDEYIEQRQAQLKQFKRWVTAEVLPTIRKTGGYVNNDELFVNTYMPYADDSTRAMFLLHLKAQRETNEKLKEMSPKAEYFDRLIDRGSALSIRDTAKSLGIKETALKELLFDHGYIYRDQKNRIRPYAEKNKGYFVLKEFNNENSGYASVQTLITVEGREKFLSLLNTEKGGIVQ